jgi:hypothetical protein
MSFGTWLETRFAYTLGNIVNYSEPNAADRLDRQEAAWSYFLLHPFGDFTWTWRQYYPAPLILEATLSTRP